MNDTSEFFTDSFEGISREFTDIQPLCQSDTSQLYRATRFGRRYVLKTLTAEALRQSMYREMLRKELEIMMSLQHPGIVQAVGLERVKDIGQCIVVEHLGDGHFLVSEAENAKLAVGDTFTCHLMIQDEPLYIDNVAHQGTIFPAYIAGKIDGVKIYKVEE